MGWEWVWIDDATDERAREKADLLTYAEAARRSGHSPTWVHRKIDKGHLQTVDYAKRRYVCAQSLAALLERDPPLSQADQEIEEASLCGNDVLAAKLERHYYPAGRPDPFDQAFPGYKEAGITRQAIATPSVARSTEELFDPVAKLAALINLEGR